MKIYILRHGHAPSITEAKVPTDFERPLSQTGREAVRGAASLLKRRGARPGLVLHSPLKRAVQTAKEVLQVLQPAPEARPYKPLENEMTGEDLYRNIVEDGIKSGEVLLVGHQPQLGELAKYLSGQYFTLKPAGLIALDVDGPEQGAVLWSENPS